MNLYSSDNILYNGTYGFSGKSNGWVSTGFTWHLLPVKSTKDEIGDTMILRFNFISDDMNSDKEGWLIDDIRLFSVPLGGANIHNSNISDHVLIYPNPSTGISMINLDNTYKDVQITVMDLSGKKISEEYFQNTQKLFLDSKNYQPGIYLIHLTLDKKYRAIKKWEVN
ncbi:MAG: T9SS type A sorting domain-containing protein [Bacteroidales bacterium]|nr:T9SS type A sorting domain-containing protein [Bacteroidales bacterium]